MCWVVCSKSIAALGRRKGKSRPSCLCMLFILHKCCPKYGSCKHITNTVGADFDSNPFRCDPESRSRYHRDYAASGWAAWHRHLHLRPKKFRLCKYLFKIPHAYPIYKKNRSEPQAPKGQGSLSSSADPSIPLTFSHSSW